MKRETKLNIRTPAEINLGRYKFSLFTYLYIFTKHAFVIVIYVHTCPSSDTPQNESKTNETMHETNEKYIHRTAVVSRSFSDDNRVD